MEPRSTDRVIVPDDHPLMVDPVFDWVYIDEPVVEDVVIKNDDSEDRANPYHDKAGKFAPKAGSGASQMVKGKDITDDVAAATSNGGPEGAPFYNGAGAAPLDNWLNDLSAMQGFDGKPQKGSVDDVIKAGGMEIHRGIVPYNNKLRGENQSAEHIANKMTDGKYEPGAGIFGNGYYFTTSAPVANLYASRPVATSGYSAKAVKGGVVVRAALHKDAKVVKYDDLKTEMKQWRQDNLPRTQSLLDAYKNDFITPPGQLSPHLVDSIAQDPGRFAVMKGYDAIQVPIHNRTADTKHKKLISKKIGTSDLGDEIVVLNRTAVVVEAT